MRSGRRMMWWPMIVVVIVAGFVVSMVAWFASSTGTGDGGLWGFGFPFTFWAPFMFVIPVMVIFMVWMFLRGGPMMMGGGPRRRRSHHAEPRSGAGASLEILKERLARGEITEEEFERIKKALGY